MTCRHRGRPRTSSVFSAGISVTLNPGHSQTTVIVVSRCRDGMSELATYPLVKVVASELHGRVGNDADTVRPVAAHEASPSLVPPHLGECLAHGHLVRLPAGALHLKQDLESFERRDHGPGDGPGDTAGAEGRNHGLRDEAAQSRQAVRRDVPVLQDVLLGTRGTRGQLGASDNKSEEPRGAGEVVNIRPTWRKRFRDSLESGGVTRDRKGASPGPTTGDATPRGGWDAISKLVAFKEMRR